ncbi:MAG: hypothetical protein COX90_01625 [Candidatus Nealsonbacteria bacterium CG_4_10_14_0_2_um_filter_38_17]|uniref:Uncharacterized protein n=2 Tax=Candidatus Nealsoniibacteriota TaxID=1817911 RepID=A0A2M7UYE1_9BACT|nr:MAG: hypothetical protein COX36_03475 [Candidatus Nealsonbacteria bacterium CG23_combo_of_CG06-09_8_20_14_all_38_19]PIZ89003.1 MAG: hypothetical protein COX90_01625 [Candidatus Nealsonbacteria bacterium CG_4_10_14_0_2_um_filter_38_17]
MQNSIIIPIVPLTNFVCTVFLVALNILFRKKSRKYSAPSVKAFGIFLVSFTMLMFDLSLSMFLARNLLLVQFVSNLYTLFFFLTVALFARFIILLIDAKNKIFYFIPFAFIFLGIALFIWQMVKIIPAGCVVFKTFKNITLILFTDSAPYLSGIIIALSGLSIFGSGAVLFLSRGLKLEDKPLRTRSLFIGYGSLAGVATIVFNSLFYILPNHIISFSFLASISVLISAILLYAGVSIGTEKKQ